MVVSDGTSLEPESGINYIYQILQESDIKRGVELIIHLIDAKD